MSATLYNADLNELLCLNKKLGSVTVNISNAVSIVKKANESKQQAGLYVLAQAAGDADDYNNPAYEVKATFYGGERYLPEDVKNIDYVLAHMFIKNHNKLLSMFNDLPEDEDARTEVSKFIPLGSQPRTADTDEEDSESDSESDIDSGESGDTSEEPKEVTFYELYIQMVEENVNSVTRHLIQNIRKIYAVKKLIQEYVEQLSIVGQKPSRENLQTLQDIGRDIKSALEQVKEEKYKGTTFDKMILLRMIFDVASVAIFSLVVLRAVTYVPAIIKYFKNTPLISDDILWLPDRPTYDSYPTQPSDYRITYDTRPVYDSQGFYEYTKDFTQSIFARKFNQEKMQNAVNEYLLEQERQLQDAMGRAVLHDMREAASRLDDNDIADLNRESFEAFNEKENVQVFTPDESFWTYLQGWMKYYKEQRNEMSIRRIVGVNKQLQQIEDDVAAKNRFFRRLFSFMNDRFEEAGMFVATDFLFKQYAALGRNLRLGAPP